MEKFYLYDATEKDKANWKVVSVNMDFVSHIDHEKDFDRVYFGGASPIAVRTDEKPS